MGFTFSHPALILPFRYLPKKYYSLSGLVIGSIVPDFEYFIRFDNDSSYSHTILGLFWFDLPLGVLIITFFHQVIRDFLINNLPDFLKLRLLTLDLVNWTNYFKDNWMIVIFSILLGSATHFLWDSFTSYNGYFVMHNPFLLMKTNLFGLEIYNYKIFKHTSSVLGGIILIHLLLKLPKNKLNDMKKNKYYWIILTILFCCCVLMKFILIHHYFSYNNMIKNLISCGLFSLTLTSLYYKTKRYLYQTKNR